MSDITPKIAPQTVWGIWPWIHIGEVVRDLLGDLGRAMTERPIQAGNDADAKEQDDG